MKRSERLKSDFELLQAKVEELTQIEQEMKGLDLSGFEEEAEAMSANLRNLDMIEQVRLQYNSLKDKANEKADYRIQALISETRGFVEKGKVEATRARDSSWLGRLILFEERYLLSFVRQFEAGEITRLDARRRVSELREQAEILSTPPPPREEPAKKRKRNYYEVLGARQDATSEQLKKMYNAVADMYHPDRAKNKKEWDEMNERMKEINEAYSVLKDEEKRKEYDEKIGRVG